MLCCVLPENVAVIFLCVICVICVCVVCTTALRVASCTCVPRCLSAQVAREEEEEEEEDRAEPDRSRDRLTSGVHPLFIRFPSVNAHVLVKEFEQLAAMDSHQVCPAAPGKAPPLTNTRNARACLEHCVCHRCAGDVTRSSLTVRKRQHRSATSITLTVPLRARLAGVEDFLAELQVM